MKLLRLFFLSHCLVVLSVTQAYGTTVREVRMVTKLVGNALEWIADPSGETPSELVIEPGQKLRFVLTHQVASGSDSAVFQIGVLGMSEKILRNQSPAFQAMKTIPEGLAPGRYLVGQPFYEGPGHVTLVVMASN